MRSNHMNSLSRHSKSLSLGTLLLTLIACSGNSLAPKSQSSIEVVTEPDSAMVTVMGQQRGTTPMTIQTSDVFPLTYPKDLEDLYGRIVLTRPGCKKTIVSISTQRLSDGVNIKLACDLSEPDSKAKPASIKQRLQQLQELKEEGLISEEEYQTMRRRILDAF